LHTTPSLCAHASGREHIPVSAITRQQRRQV
jgi:hypothetical protein